MAKIYIIRNDKTFVGIADNLADAKLIAQEDADDFKINQILAKGFLKLFKKHLVKLEHPRYTFLQPISEEVATVEVF